MIKPPSKEEQARALLNRTAYRLLERYPSDVDYKDIFTIKKKDLFDYIKKNSRLEDLIFTRLGDNDGFYAIKEMEGEYLTFGQERGIRFDEVEVHSVDEVLNKFIDYLLSGSGTGLEFD